jgi:hypothetical protein
MMASDLPLADGDTSPEGGFYEAYIHDVVETYVGG